MATIDGAPSLLAGALIKKLYRQDLSRTDGAFERFKEKLREYGQQFKQYSREHPHNALALKIGVPALLTLSWLFLILVYNMYSTLRTNCEYYRSQIGVEVRRRDDLVPNLAAFVARYSAHESEIMRHVSDARRALSSPGDVGVKLEAAKAMEGALARLLAVAERYPDLKAAQPVQLLLKELSNTENRIADWKGKYNDSARAFNNIRTSIPTNYIGWCLGIREPVPYINTDEDLMRVYALKLDEGRGR